MSFGVQFFILPHPRFIKNYIAVNVNCLGYEYIYREELQEWTGLYEGIRNYSVQTIHTRTFKSFV